MLPILTPLHDLGFSHSTVNLRHIPTSTRSRSFDVEEEVRPTSLLLRFENPQFGDVFIPPNCRLCCIKKYPAHRPTGDPNSAFPASESMLNSCPGQPSTSSLGGDRVDSARLTCWFVSLLIIIVTNIYLTLFNPSPPSACTRFQNAHAISDTEHIAGSSSAAGARLWQH
jgi:hypothetical protein